MPVEMPPLSICGSKSETISEEVRNNILAGNRNWEGNHTRQSAYLKLNIF